MAEPAIRLVWRKIDELIDALVTADQAEKLKESSEFGA